MIITEPVTSITDVILAIISFTLFFRVRSNCVKSEFHNAWRMFFLFMGITTAIGAITHGLADELGPKLHYDLWMLMTISPSIAVFYSIKATIQFSYANIYWTRIFNWLNIIVLSIFITCTLLWNNFEILKIHAGIGVMVILITHIKAMTLNHFGSGLIVSAFIISLLTIAIHSFQISLSVWFNFKDISHVMIMISLILIYTGVYRMSQNTKPSFRRAQLAIAAK